MKNSILILVIFASQFLISCSKNVDPPQESPKGQVSFYNIKYNYCDTIKIVCENQNGIITKKYAIDSSSCGSEGTFTISLDTGVHKFTATCGTMKSEKEVIVKANECTKQGVGFDVAPSLDGIWTLDLSLEADGSNCDETMLEDEAHIPPTLRFLSNDWIKFETDPVESDLNGKYFTNQYEYNFPDLKIWSTYDDGTETMHFQCILKYDWLSSKFIGTYMNQWNGGLNCINGVELYR
ncbi:MAG: hypothetical protein WC716_04435 [Chitinophagaceae bacterium]|jgi:hypothetical protein